MASTESHPPIIKIEYVTSTTAQLIWFMPVPPFSSVIATYWRDGMVLEAVKSVDLFRCWNHWGFHEDPTGDSYCYTRNETRAILDSSLLALDISIIILAGISILASFRKETKKKTSAASISVSVAPSVTYVETSKTDEPTTT